MNPHNEGKGKRKLTVIPWLQQYWSEVLHWETLPSLLGAAVATATRAAKGIRVARRANMFGR